MSAVNGRAAPAQTADIGREFVRLALGVAQHVPACLQQYWGPAGWAVEPLSLETLRDQAVAVATAIQRSHLPERRRARLQLQTRALLWLIRARLGETIMFREQVRLLVDVTPESLDGAAFATAQAGLAAVLPGAGDLSQRWQDWQAALTRPLTEVWPQLEAALAYLAPYRPDDDPIDLAPGPPGGAIEYRPGRVTLPADMAVRVDRLVLLAAAIAANAALVAAAARRYAAGAAEDALWLNYGPQQVLALGLAPALLAPANPYEDIVPDLLRAVGIAADGAAQLPAIHLAEAALEWVDGNVALMLHGEGMRSRVLRRYLVEYKLVTADQADRRLAQLADPFPAAHLFAGLVGGPLVSAWLAKTATTLADLLADPPAPSQMLFAVRFGD